MNSVYEFKSCTLRTLRIHPGFKLATLSASDLYLNETNKYRYYCVRENFILLLHARLLICLFQYSDRFTPVLLIVSLAGIKVCSPDGKVSTRDAHSYSCGKGYFAFVRTLLWRNRLAAACGIFQDGASSPRALHEKFASLFFCSKHDCISLRHVTFGYLLPE